MPLDPAQHSNLEDDDKTVVTSNKHIDSTYGAATTRTMPFANTHVVANTGATSLFVMEGLTMDNVQIATSPLSINLPDGGIVKSHVQHCDPRPPYGPHRTYRPRTHHGIPHWDTNLMQGRLQGIIH